MELDPGHAAFSYPSRPCKLDRSFSWTGPTKSSSQYPSNDHLSFDYGRSQTQEFFDVPSMFEDALRQLTSSPCFADSFQTKTPLVLSPAIQNSMVSTEVKHIEGSQGGPTEFPLNDYEAFYDTAVSLEPQQDFSSHLWPTSTSDSRISSSPLVIPVEPSNPILQDSDMPSYLLDQFINSSSFVDPETQLAMTTLETIEEEIGFTFPNEDLQQIHQSQEGAMWPGDYGGQVLSANPFQFVGGDNSDISWQPLATPSLGEIFAQSGLQDHSVDESAVVLVKVDVKVLTPGGSAGEPVLTPPLSELMSKFDSNPASPLPKHIRRKYTEIRKTKVKQVRINGACISCKARKVPCTVEGACDACVKLARRSPLADHICVRTKLKDTYIGVRALHGSSFDSRKARLTTLLSSLTGRPEPVQFSVESYEDHDSVPFRNNDHHIRTLASLDIQVMQCSSSSLCRWKKVTKVSGIYITSDIFEGQRYVIVPSSLPTIDEFDRFGRNILLASDGGHSGNITLLLDQFLTAYCTRQKATSAHSIANLTARIASLNNLVAYGFLNLRDGSYDLLQQSHHHQGSHGSQRYISETVHDQIRLLAAEGLEPAEKILFGELDNISKLISGNQHARAIVGICLLRLMLLYRDRLVRDDIRLRLPRQKKWHQYRLEKASFMYRRLTVTYGTLCREYDTPLTMAWEDENDVNSAGEQERLKALYLQLQPAFQGFCKDKLTLQYDDVVKILLADPAKQQRTKKRRKVHH